MRAFALALFLLLGVLIAGVTGADAAQGTATIGVAHSALTMGSDGIGAAGMDCHACDGMGTTAPAGTCHGDGASCAAGAGCGAFALGVSVLSPVSRPGDCMQPAPLFAIAAQSACVPDPPPPRI